MKEKENDTLTERAKNIFKSQRNGCGTQPIKARVKSPRSTQPYIALAFMVKMMLDPVHNSV